MKNILSFITGFIFISFSFSAYGLNFYFPAYYPSSYFHRVELPVEQHGFINKMPISDSAKKALYEYSGTPEGQEILVDLMNPSLLGPTGASITTPVAFAADWGIVAAAVAAVSNWEGTKKEDGLANVAFGLGNAEKYFGLTTSILIDSIDTRDGGFGENGTVLLQLFRVFPNDFAVGIGASNILPWGHGFKDRSKNYYAVASKVLPLYYRDYSLPLTLSVGAGTGVFSALYDFRHDVDDNVRPFFSAGWRLFPKLSIVGEWVARESNAGISYAPIRSFPVVLGIAACNINKRDNQSTYYMASVAFGYDFANH